MRNEVELLFFVAGVGVGGGGGGGGRVGPAVDEVGVVGVEGGEEVHGEEI